MKTMYTSFGIVIFLFQICFTQFSFSQATLFQTKKAGSGASAAEGCLACPGTEWTDAKNIKQKDGQFAYTAMTAKDYCFQSACYFSRGLIASEFGFNIPLDATVKGIKVKVVRNAETEHTVKDYAVQLMKAGILVGDNKSANAFWPATSGQKGYGGNTDLWGTTWKPEEVNDPGFGYWLQSRNTTNMQNVAANVDLVKIIVYYTIGADKYLPAALPVAENEMKVYPNPASENVTLSFNAARDGNALITLYNQLGLQVLSLNEEIKEGSFTKVIGLSSFPPGTYFLRVAMNDYVQIKRIIRQ